MWTYLYFCVRIYHDKFCKMLHKLTQGIEDILHSPCFPKVITWMTRMSGWNLPSIILVLQVYGICILYSIYVIQDSLKTKWLLFVYDHLIFLSNPFYQSNSLMLRDLILFCPSAAYGGNLKQKFLFSFSSPSSLVRNNLMWCQHCGCPEKIPEKNSACEFNRCLKLLIKSVHTLYKIHRLAGVGRYTRGHHPSCIFIYASSIN